MIVLRINIALTVSLCFAVILNAENIRFDSSAMKIACPSNSAFSQASLTCVACQSGANQVLDTKSGTLDRLQSIFVII